MARPLPKTPVPAPNLPVDADALPPSPAQRAKLLFILIILPVLVVSLPAILVTAIFGQRPKPKDTPPKPNLAEVSSGLQSALDRSAQQLLPTPAGLAGEPIRLTSRPDRLAARAERVAKLAESLGGEADEFLAGEGEKHFFVRLPPGRAEAFRQSLLGGDNPPAATPVPATAAPATAAKDQVEVFIRVKEDE